jgi:hypothetical protein
MLLISYAFTHIMAGIWLASLYRNTVNVPTMGEQWERRTIYLYALHSLYLESSSLEVIASLIY